MKFDKELEEGEIRISSKNYELEEGEVRRPNINKKDNYKFEQGEIRKKKIKKEKYKFEKREILKKNKKKIVEVEFVKKNNILEEGEIQKLEVGEISKNNILEKGEIQKLEAGEISKDKVKLLKKKRCNVCRKNKTNYTCPGCLINYCDINCYKNHKEKFNCSGKINFSKKIRKGDMSEKSLKNDIFHINNLLRKSNKIKKKINVLDKGFLKNKELMRYKLLKIHAKKKNIDLKIIPNIFENHRRNISFYYMGTKTIFWNLEIVFVKKKNIKNNYDNLKIYKYFTDPIEDNKNLIDIIDLVDSKNLKIVEFFNGYFTQENIKKKFSENQFFFYFNDEEKFLELDPLDKIENILVNKKITEFPIFYIFDFKIDNLIFTPKKFKKIKEIIKIN